MKGTKSTKKTFDINSLPPAHQGETIEDYFRRCLEAGASILAISRVLNVQRAGLYKKKDGGGMAALGQARFGALVGLLEPVAETKQLLSLLGLLDAAEEGWRLRSIHLGAPDDVAGR